jgi:hypothetical protein
MEEIYFDETRITARLPRLDIEIIHGRSASGDAERLSRSVLAVPSFEALGRYAEAANPFLFWLRVAQTAWAPWLGASSASVPRGDAHRFPAPPDAGTV